MDICVYKYVHVYMYIYIYIHKYTYIYIYTCTYIYFTYIYAYIYIDVLHIYIQELRRALQPSAASQAVAASPATNAPAAPTSRAASTSESLHPQSTTPPTEAAVSSEELPEVCAEAIVSKSDIVAEAEGVTATEQERDSEVENANSAVIGSRHGTHTSAMRSSFQHGLCSTKSALTLSATRPPLAVVATNGIVVATNVEAGIDVEMEEGGGGAQERDCTAEEIVAGFDQVVDGGASELQAGGGGLDAHVIGHKDAGPRFTCDFVRLAPPPCLVLMDDTHFEKRGGPCDGASNCGGGLVGGAGGANGGDGSEEVSSVVSLEMHGGGSVCTDLMCVEKDGTCDPRPRAVIAQTQHDSPEGQALVEEGGDREGGRKQGGSGSSGGGGGVEGAGGGYSSPRVANKIKVLRQECGARAVKSPLRANRVSLGSPRAGGGGGLSPLRANSPRTGKSKCANAAGSSSIGLRTRKRGGRLVPAPPTPTNENADPQLGAECAERVEKGGVGACCDGSGVSEDKHKCFSTGDDVALVPVPQFAGGGHGVLRREQRKPTHSGYF